VLRADLKFSDMPVGCFASLEATPTLGWLQIMAFTCASETGYAGTTSGLVKQSASKAPGDIGGSQWKRYSDPAEKAFKLNVERNNGRAAMMGITGCLVHELLGVDALYPTGGLGGAAPAAIL
jgi:light-harvesting complex I chlorophyll a/b binding protein 1